MTLRTKTLLITGLTLAVMTGTLHLIASYGLTHSFESVEYDETRQNVRRARDAVAQRLEELDSKVGDWATWDDVYDYVETGNAEFVPQNVTCSALMQLRVTHIAVVHRSGRIVYAGAREPGRDQLTSVIPSFTEALNAYPSLLSGEGRGTMGIITLGDTLLLVASRPILNSAHAGPSRGSLVFGVRVDRPFIRSLSERTHLEVRLKPVSGDALRSLQSKLEESQEAELVQVVSEKAISGCALMPDVSGDPAALLEIRLNRRIQAEGERVIERLTFTLLIAGLLCAALLLWLLERVILARLGDLMSQVSRIGSQSDAAMTVMVPGSDELAALASCVNTTLSAFWKSQERLRASEADARRSELRYRQTINSLAEPLHVIDADTRIVVYNEPLRKWNAMLGLCTEMMGHTVMEVFPFLNARTVEEYRSVFETGQPVTTEERHTIAGREMILRTRKIPVFNESRVEHVITLVADVSASRQVEERLRTLSQAVEQSANMVIITDAGGRIEYVNKRFTELTGYLSEEVMGQTPRLLKSDAHPPEFYREIWNTISSGRNWSGEICNRRKNGEVYWESSSISPIRSDQGHITHFLALKEDITERKWAEKTLRITQFSIDRASDAIFWIREDAKLVYVNDAACRSLGYSREQLLSMSVPDIDPAFPVERWPSQWANVKKQGYVRFESCQRTIEGESRPVEISVNFVEYDGQEYNCAIARDVTERKRAEDQLRHAALHDALTGLPNRALFTEHLAKALQRCHRHPDYKFAVMFLDFDRFKIINDSLGHQMGDQLLVSISRRLHSCLRSQDTISRPGGSEIARLGGDEFVILLDGIGHAPDAARVAERLQEQMSTPFHINGHEIHTSVSIGIVASESSYERPEDMIRDADTAMYRAKTFGKARHVIFDRQMHDQAMYRLRIESELRKAVERDECSVVYQPIISLESGALEGFEALVRWNHPERGVISPADFVPIAEETGLIVPIGLSVLRKACRALAELQGRAAGRPPLSMSVNLSKRQLIEEGLVRQTAAILAETGVDPRQLKLEVTESVIMEHAEAVTPVLRQLKSLGVQLAMDDFGTGHSSLSCLHRFPIDVLKIDQAFVSNMTVGNIQYAAIVQAIVTLAHNLGMAVVAEGIETTGQLAQLQTLNCDFGQGFVFSRPVLAEEAIPFIHRTAWIDAAAQV